MEVAVRFECWRSFLTTVSHEQRSSTKITKRSSTRAISCSSSTSCLVKSCSGDRRGCPHRQLKDLVPHDRVIAFGTRGDDGGANPGHLLEARDVLAGFCRQLIEPPHACRRRVPPRHRLV